MVTKKAGRKAPVVLASGVPSRRRRKRERGETFDAQALSAPVPGQLLVLLSRLHRTESSPMDTLGSDGSGRLPSRDADL